jgi:hypothetical protein
MGGRADFELKYESSEVDKADAVKTMTLNDGGRVQLKGNVSKDLDNGATASLEAVVNVERSEVKSDAARVKYANGPLTVTMIKAQRPGTFKKGIDMYIPAAAGDPGKYQNDWVSEQGVSFEYAGEGMKFATTLNVHPGDGNRIGVRPYVEMMAAGATIRAAAEVVSDTPTNTDADGPKQMNFGGGVSAVATLGAIEVGASGAYGVKGGKDDAGKDVKKTNQMSVYGYAKMSVGAGAVQLAGGYNMQSVEDVDNDATGFQGTLSYEQKNVVVPGLILTATVGYASATDAAKVDSTLTGGKIRLRYEF